MRHAVVAAVFGRGGRHVCRRGGGGYGPEGRRIQARGGATGVDFPAGDHDAGRDHRPRRARGFVLQRGRQDEHSQPPEAARRPETTAG
ncbi:MAG: hypothetical protein BJ554DRAFT_1002 [Olpidium bornovanus]|uniref:Uncharacterized protein n=1 Tax=Olpidium bornovanus TaxID=278681 RepID=A0A8H8DI56_9FUNG|nr:MAG: hypothetical protein BJ554DRAFT_1002 [Olpidium bornovanus]